MTAISSIVRDTSDAVLRLNIFNSYVRSKDSGLAVTAKDWYVEAHEEIRKFSFGYGIRLERATGIVAALSPHVPWIWTIRNAQRFVTGRKTTAYLRNEIKAGRIRAGEDPLKVLGGDKTRSFYTNLLHSGHDGGVTVDTWSFRVALGEEWYREPISAWTHNAYVRVADCYKFVAASVGLIPAEIQAITWKQCKLESGLTHENWKLIEV